MPLLQYYPPKFNVYLKVSENYSIGHLVYFVRVLRVLSHPPDTSCGQTHTWEACDADGTGVVLHLHGLNRKWPIESKHNRMICKTFQKSNNVL